MLINKTNAYDESVENVTLHDALFNGFEFDQIDRVLKTIVGFVGKSNEVSIEFLNVIGITMSKCDFWGASSHISCFSIAKANERLLICELFKRKKSENSSFCPLKSEDDYIEAVIDFISGDQLRVACESVTIISMGKKLID